MKRNKVSFDPTLFFFYHFKKKKIIVLSYVLHIHIYIFAISLVATVLVQRGTMKIGTMVVAGEAFGKVGSCSCTCKY